MKTWLLCLLVCSGWYLLGVYSLVDVPSGYEYGGSCELVTETERFVFINEYPNSRCGLSKQTPEQLLQQVCFFLARKRSKLMALPYDSSFD
jgi:hypothetical protein